MKWFAYAGIATLVLLPGNTALATTPVLQVMGFVDVILLPAAIGIAILKYRLYDIDRLISRTLSYAIVTGLLVGLYAGLVLLATGACAPVSGPRSV